MTAAAAVYASIPSPSVAEWSLGPLTLRVYALAILVGIFVATWLTTKRWVARGGDAEDVYTIVFWAVPFGIIGGRIYHVITTPRPYFGEGGDPLQAFAIWKGGLGIWGAIAFGAVGAYIGCRKTHVRFSSFADAVAPGLLIAQAIGRLGNWFNQELFGGVTTLPWGLEIAPEYIPAGYDPGTLFHPTFLYEMLWNLAAAGLLLYLDKRFRLGYGRVFWLYVVLYTTGRLWIEMLRIDTAEDILGLRLNVWTSIIVGLGGLVAFYVIGRRHTGREESVFLSSRPIVESSTADSSTLDSSALDSSAVDSDTADDGETRREPGEDSDERVVDDEGAVDDEGQQTPAS